MIGLAPVMLLSTLSAQATVEVEGVKMTVVDAHLHTLESPGDFNQAGKASIIRGLPAFVAPYYSAMSEHMDDPFAPALGIADQLDWAGVDRAVLMAKYTHHTVGFATNRYIESLIADPRNITEDGTPRFYGMASIDLDDFENLNFRALRLNALSTYLEDPGFIGIKLAHTHQAVTFDDPVLDELYALAAEHRVPVVLHTGVSPFPGTKRDARYTNPIGLEKTIARYSGLGEERRVEFVLSHVGTADATATADSIYLASMYDNVWLEVSALSQDMIFGPEGEDSGVAGPQHPWILKRIIEMDLVERTIFATDGPQQPGMVRSYLNDIINSMQAAGYSTDDMQRVLAGSFYDCFGVRE